MSKCSTMINIDMIHYHETINKNIEIKENLEYFKDLN